MVHRDLKPSNVLLAEDGPRVIDFGISRAVEAVTMLTQAGLVVGSPGFMSPEQAMGGEVGPPSDVFNLGAVLAFAATGEGPFGTGTTAALLYRVAHGEPDLDRVPPRVRPLIERCLAKDPAQRPTASGLLSEVGALQPDGNWLPDSLTRTFAASAGSGVSRRSRRPAPRRSACRSPGYAPTGGPGFAPTSGPGLAAPRDRAPLRRPVPGTRRSAPGLAAYAAPEPGLTPTRTTAAGAGTLPTPPPATPRRRPRLGTVRRRLRPGTARRRLRLDTVRRRLRRDTARRRLRSGTRRRPRQEACTALPGGGNQPRRRRVRPLMLALIIGVMLGAVGAAVFVRDLGHQAHARPAQRPPGRRDVLGPGPLVERADQRLPVSLAQRLVERSGVHAARRPA